MQNTDLPKDPDDPHVDLDYVGYDEEMEDDSNEKYTYQDTEANTNADDDDDDHDDDDHDGDDHDDAVASSIQ